MIRVDHFGDPEDKGRSPLRQGPDSEGHCGEPQCGEHEGLAGGGGGGREVTARAVTAMEQYM